jgi:hypothetical protein
VLEAMACAEALCLAEDLGVTNLLISSDCKEVIEMMKTNNLCRYSALLKEIVERSSYFEFVNFIFESRESTCRLHTMYLSLILLNKDPTFPLKKT